jgi:hypothetical protein
MLHESGLHPSFWAQAAAHAVYIRNRIPRADGITPHEMMFKSKPRTDHLRVFGCAAIKMVKESSGKSMTVELSIFSLDMWPGPAMLDFTILKLKSSLSLAMFDILKT